MKDDERGRHADRGSASATHWNGGVKVAVVYATLGRADTMTRAPDLTLISAVSPSDVPPLAPDWPIKVLFGPKGLPAQRNTALRALGESADLIVFFDDDFAPAADFLEQVEALFNADEELAGATGKVVADGIGGPGFSFEDAQRFLAGAPARPFRSSHSRRVGSLYGCNMVIRSSRAKGLTFDETLPLYAWQEDVDFTVQLSRRGKLIWSDALAGVHLGVKRSRSPGRPLGYAQIANPIFLRRKRTMTRAHAYSLMGRNLAANLVRSLSPEPWCDRRGRLVGNLLAIGDFCRGKLHPLNILDLRPGQRKMRP
jgi:hypothetical protein